MFHQSSTSPGFPALVINAASNGSETPLISARTNVNNATGIGEHSDIVEAIQEELDKMAHAEDRIEMLEKYFV